MTQELFSRVCELIDSANAKDLNIENDGNKDWPKELLYTHRMADMLQRFAPDADDVMGLAIRAQHIERWKSARSDYPMDKKGYYQWRTQLYQFHADTLAELMLKAGYDSENIERAKLAVGKKNLKNNPDTQLLENISALVFIEHYMLEFAEKHPEYDEDKWITIILRTWNKMSEQAQQFALSGDLILPEPLIPLITKSISQ